MSEQTTAGAAVPQWDLADRMQKALRHAGVGVQEMADYLGVGRNTVSTWTHGRIRPSKQTLRLWALRCGVSYDWLVTGMVMPDSSQSVDANTRCCGHTSESPIRRYQRFIA